MATYTELAGITAEAGFGAFQDKIRVGVIVKAVALLDATTPTAAQVAWAEAALAAPAKAANDVIWYVIGSNKAANLTAILGAGDSAVQTNVDAAVDAIVSV